MGYIFSLGSTVVILIHKKMDIININLIQRRGPKQFSIFVVVTYQVPYLSEVYLPTNIMNVNIQSTQQFLHRVTLLYIY